MPESKIIGYKKIFGFVLPNWVNEGMVKNLGIGLFAVAVMFSLLFFVIRPNLEVLKDREKTLISSRNELDILKISKVGLDKLRTDLSDEDQSRILSSMPQSYSPDAAVYALRQISADTGVSIVSYNLPSGDILSSVSPVSGQITTGDMVSFTSFPIKLIVSAPVENLLKFVSGVESSLPFGIVSDLNVQEVSRLSRTEIDKSVQIAMEIKYYQSTLKSVNLNKLQPLTPDDLKLASELRQYNLLSVPLAKESSQGEPQVGKGSIFGF